MKKVLISILSIVSLYSVMNAVTYVSVKTDDGQTVVFDAKDIAEINYEETNSLDVTVSGKIGNYTYVDLGLPSGLKWATYNVGAKSAEETGSFFAWGETEAKDTYSWSSYKLCEGDESTLTKYCTDQNFGTKDDLVTLEAADDAATQIWGSAWHIPNLDEIQELISGCKWEWQADQNGSGVSGMLGISITNGNSIFLPAFGFITVDKQSDKGTVGYYWSASLKNSQNAICISLTSKFIRNESVKERSEGLLIRAVAK